jgi:hypothetical protein
VNNRDGDEYRESEDIRNGFLREIVAPALGLKPEALTFYSPYWGEHGAQFAWDMAVLPSPENRFETFAGVSKDSPEYKPLGRVNTLICGSPESFSGNVVVDARKDFPAVVDLIYASALAGAKTEKEARDLALSYKLAADYAEAKNKPDWLERETTTEGNFLGSLVTEASAKPVQSFGGRRILDALNEGLSRLKTAIPAKTTAAAGKLWRKDLNTTVSRFAGDAFTYLAQRAHEKEEINGVKVPGPIVSTVLNALRDADSQRNKGLDGDDKLIVIAHSFGGEIMYDILTYYWNDLTVDCLVTVGSQVGLFEEMKLYHRSQAMPPPGQLPCPTNVKRWHNVFDFNDIFSYCLAPVIDGVKDYSYDTGYSTLSAHGGYFLRPSFYRRLAMHLAEG